MRVCGVFLVILVHLGGFSSQGKTYRTCELARALANEGVPRSLISNFVCLAEAVSGSNTTKVNKATPTVSNFGIFQINTKEYCGQNGKAGGKCNIKCEKLLDDPISDDIKCAKKIQEDLGFKHWSRWNVRCKSTDPQDRQKYLPNLHNCLHRK